jgi:hypothetical protein
MSLRPIVRALGGDLYAGGFRANIPAPGHSRHDRSVSLLWSGGRVVVHSFGGADWREVLDALRAQGLIDRANRPVGAGRGPVGAAPAAPNPERLAVARALWVAGRPVAGALAERHLRQRAIHRSLTEALRHHPAVPFSVYAQPPGVTGPALLAAIKDPAGVLTAVEITYLDLNGNRALRPRLSRKTVGLVPLGSAVRLDPAAAAMLVAEGVATTLSASERFALPGWALLSTRNLRAWSPPDGVASVLVAGDRGPDGEASAGRLVGRLRRMGVAAEPALPPAPFSDWNEVSLVEERGGRGRVRSGAGLVRPGSAGA